LAAFGRVVYNGGDIYNLLSSMIFFTDIFNIGSGDRLDVTNVVIAITDGVPLVDFKDTKAVTSALQKIGAKVIPVCIAPGCRESFASGLASEPKQVRNAKNIYNLSVQDQGEEDVFALMFTILCDLIMQLDARSKIKQKLEEETSDSLSVNERDSVTSKLAMYKKESNTIIIMLI